MMKLPSDSGLLRNLHEEVVQLCSILTDLCDEKLSPKTEIFKKLRRDWVNFPCSNLERYFDPQLLEQYHRVSNEHTKTWNGVHPNCRIQEHEAEKHMAGFRRVVSAHFLVAEELRDRIEEALIAQANDDYSVINDRSHEQVSSLESKVTEKWPPDDGLHVKGGAAWYRGKEYSITPKAGRILERLIKAGSVPLEKREIIRAGWDADEAPAEDTIYTHLGMVRKVLRRMAEDNNFPREISNNPLPPKGGHWRLILPN